MISVEIAEQKILENLLEIPAEAAPLEQCVGRILVEDLFADRDFPPFDRVTMDGIALAFDALEKQQAFKIESVSAAGSRQSSLKCVENCIEVMTGAMLPHGTDTVIRYEDLSIENGIAKIMVLPEKKGQNVHYQGFDKKKGELLVKKGRKISAAEIGVAATIGKEKLEVLRPLKAMVVSTGDEIIPILETPQPHQIRMSNGYALQAQLRAWGVEADNVLLPDNEAVIRLKIAEFLLKYDVIVLSGGVSAGKFDYVPKVLEENGIRKVFHKVSQRPGKPFWFGVSDFNKVVFALPGNPVSTFICLNRYFKKWLFASQKANYQQLHAELAVDFTFKPDLTYFLQVSVEFNTVGKIIARPVEGNGSGDLSNLTDADAFIELPKEKISFKKGEVYPIYWYR